MAKASGDWVHERTLGYHSNHFWWRLDAPGAVSVLLVRTNNAGRKQQVVRAFSGDGLEQLLGFMADGQWHPTAACTSTLKADPPPDGIATFLHRTLQFSSRDAMLGAQLAIVLTNAGLWEWNRLRSRMRFRQVSADLGRVADYFARRQADPGPRPPAARDVPRRRQAGTKSRPRSFDLAASFRGRNAELRGRLEAIDGGAHAVSKGQRREAALRGFLRRHLPATYGVGRGEVAASWGQLSRQVDILIYDALAPVLLDDGGSLVVAADSVYAAIEVKPQLNADYLRDAVDNIRSVKTLRVPPARLPDGRGVVPSPRPPIFGAVLARQSVDHELMARHLRELQQDLPPCLCTDCVCILDKAVIHRQCGGPGPSGWDPAQADQPAPLAYVESGEDSLLYFHLMLLQDLKAKTLPLPDLLLYAQSAHFPEPKML